MIKRNLIWLSILFVLLFPSVLRAAIIKGIVFSALGRPIAGAPILVKEEGRKVWTDAEGRFLITISNSLARVHLRFEVDEFYDETLVIEARDFSTPLKVALYPSSVGYMYITVSASREEMAREGNSVASTIVSREALDRMPRAIAADEALKSVPGIKVDNQANGERVHLSIRGQGILTERGIRGIQVVLDGIPLNDPSGFVPDLFDVDWATVDQIKVIRGPMGFLYGGGSAGGVINISTRDGSSETAAGRIWTSAGSNGFWKAVTEGGGTAGKLNYRLSLSRSQGDGYRQHTAFWSNNFYGKFCWEPSTRTSSTENRFKLTTVVAGSGFFNQNAEGLNLQWLEQDRRMANPDALTFNEYQKTRRLTVGVNGRWLLNDRPNWYPTQNIFSFTVYGRSTLYNESVPSSVQHRSLFTPGVLVQFQQDRRNRRTTNHFSVGLDADWQGIDEYRHPNLGQAIEGPELLSDQRIRQNGLGLFIMDSLQWGERWTILVGLRGDRFGNRLNDRLQANRIDLSGRASFNRATARAGLAWNPVKKLTLYANWGTGFLPPATEELYANPQSLGGFNRELRPALSGGGEIGLNANLGNRMLLDLAFFHLTTRDDFERFRIPGRPLETFYRNSGHSLRNGLEASLRLYPLDFLTIEGSYTYSDFIYTQYQSVTYPGNLKGHVLPNSPRHQVYIDASARFSSRFFGGLSVEGVSRSAIDATNAVWISGYALIHARLGFRWSGRIQGEAFLSVRNLAAKKYIAFTEPDPDGNSYQPGPGREFFATVEIRI